MKHPTLTQIQDLAASLCGTCGGPSDALIEEKGMNPAAADEIAARLELEGEIFLCDGCGWWCEDTEMNISSSGRFCDDCMETS